MLKTRVSKKAKVLISVFSEHINIDTILIEKIWKPRSLNLGFLNTLPIIFGDVSETTSNDIELYLTFHHIVNHVIKKIIKTIVTIAVSD